MINFPVRTPLPVHVMMDQLNGLAEQSESELQTARRQSTRPSITENQRSSSSVTQH